MEKIILYHGTPDKIFTPTSEKVMINMITAKDST